MNFLSRRSFLKAAGISIAALAFTKSLQAMQTPKRKPNFIFILADDLGWGDLHCYGNRYIKTPNLDNFAKQGTLFTQFYVNSGVCSPSRAAFMTSLFPARIRMHGHLDVFELNEKRGMPNFLDPNIPTVTSLLQKAGYTTGHFGKWHLGGGPGCPTPKEYGVDDHCITAGNGKTFDIKIKQAPYWLSKADGLIVDETIRFVEQNKEKPFYVNLWLMAPHAVLNPEPELMEPYKSFGPKIKEGEEPRRGAMQIYYSVITNIDTQLGRLFKKLDELGLSDNTVVIFSSDNGPEDIHLPDASHSGVGSSGPFRGLKRSLYEGGVRMPFIVRWPTGGVPANSVDNDNIISGVDLLPTVCSLADVKLPDDLKPDGQDMSKALKGKYVERKKPLMWEWREGIIGNLIYHSPMLAIREGKWKLLMNPDRSRVELYNIPKDPMEVDNIADDNPKVVKALAKKLLAWQKTLPTGPIGSGAGKNDYAWPKSQQ